MIGRVEAESLPTFFSGLDQKMKFEETLLPRLPEHSWAAKVQGARRKAFAD